jgi:hypothetical protein
MVLRGLGGLLETENSMVEYIALYAATVLVAIKVFLANKARLATMPARARKRRP